MILIEYNLSSETRYQKDLLCLDSKVKVAYYLSILLSLNASLLPKLNIVSFSCSPETGQNVLENLQNLEQFACKMRVRIHGFFTQQVNSASQETSVFSLGLNFPPSFNPHKTLWFKNYPSVQNLSIHLF